MTRPLRAIITFRALVAAALLVAAGCGANTTAQPHSPVGPSALDVAPSIGAMGSLPKPSSADVRIDYLGGKSNANGGITYSRADTVSLNVSSDHAASGAAATFSVDVFVLSSPPPPYTGGQAITASQFPNRVWEWQEAAPQAEHSFSVDNGSAASLTVTWPKTDRSGQAVPSSRYFIVVSVYRGGQPFERGVAVVDLA